MAKRPTRADAARLAGVSTPTVSKIFRASSNGLGGRVRIVADFPDGTFAEIPVKSGKPVTSKAKIAPGQDRKQA